MVACLSTTAFVHEKYLRFTSLKMEACEMSGENFRALQKMTRNENVWMFVIKYDGEMIAILIWV